MFLAFTTEVDNRLEQKLETIVIQCLLYGVGRIALVHRFVIGWIVNQHAVALLVAGFLLQLRRGGMSAPHQVRSLGCVFGNRCNPDTQGQLHRAAVDVKQVVLHLLADGLTEFRQGFFFAGLTKQAESIIAQAGENHILGRLFLEQRGQIAEHKVGAGYTNLAFEAHEIIESDVGQGAGLVVLACFCNRLAKGVHQILPVEQAGQQILAADLANLLLQLSIAVFRLDDNLGADLAVIGSC